MRSTIIIHIALLMLTMSGASHAASTLGQIHLKDGSQLHGEIISMVDGTFKAKASFSPEDPIPISWSEVTGITTKDSIVLVLKNGVTLHGTAQPGKPGTIQLATDLIKVTISVLVDSVIAINPPERKPVHHKGNINFGGTLTSGNTDLKQGNLLGDLVI